MSLQFSFFELLFYLAIEGYYLLNVDGWQQNKFSFAELALTFLPNPFLTSLKSLRLREVLD